MNNINKSILLAAASVILSGCLYGCIGNEAKIVPENNQSSIGMPIPGSGVTDSADNTDSTETEISPDDGDTIISSEAENTEDDLQKETPPEKETDEWNLILVNPWNDLPEDFDVKMTELKGGHKIDERAYPDLQAMMDDMRKAELSPYICSSYRTVAYQQRLFDNQVKKQKEKGLSQDKAAEEAAKWVAIPGTSEHHTGLALDIVAADYTVLDESQENTEEQKWLLENSWKYGFILRYPNGKTDITGIYYEPWHYRYVGKEAAKEIYERDITLEEYLGKTN